MFWYREWRDVYKRQACAYSHFLQYGLQLREREEYSFEPADLGNIYHMVLERFAGKLAEHGKTWFNFDETEADAWLKEALLESTTCLLYTSRCV